jgi:hypothetical protein
MKRLLKALLVLAGIVLVSFPLTFITFLLVPLWAWIERTYQIEAIGHSGPSEWCFWLVFSLLTLALTFIAWRNLRPKRV